MSEPERSPLLTKVAYRYGNNGTSTEGERSQLPLAPNTSRLTARMNETSQQTSQPPSLNSTHGQHQHTVGLSTGEHVIHKPTPTGKRTHTKSIERQARSRKSISEFRRKRRLLDYETWRGRIGVHVEVDQYNLQEVETVVMSLLPGWACEDGYEYLRLWQVPINPIQADLPQMDATTPEIFLFSFGAAVLFNFPSEAAEKEFIVAYLLPYPSLYGERKSEQAIAKTQDDIEFVYGDEFSIKHDVCQLSTKDSGEKLAVAFAVAKSSLMMFYEFLLQQNIERNSYIPEQMANTGKITMTKKELSKEIGQIFLVMHEINLDSNIQDTPEEFG
eukprot:scaffold33693_cov49-Attheya_sp.AAC.6